jgi:hypothetical protein
MAVGNNLSKLTIDINEFQDSILNLAAEGATLYKAPAETDAEFEALRVQFKEWSSKSLTFLQNSFELKANSYADQFDSASGSMYNFGNQDLKQKLYSLKQDISAKENALLYTERLVKISDVVNGQNIVDLSSRAKYSTDEKLALILEKLYHVYDDYYTSIADILTGNGIKLRRRGEDSEFAEILEGNGYINMMPARGMGEDEPFVQLSINGVRYIESQLTIIESNVGSSRNQTTEELEKRMNEVIEKLTTLGYGQEVLFNELQEIKDVFPTLNNKTWRQLIKGKIVDMVVGKVLSVDAAKFVYEHVTGNSLHIPLLGSN